MAVKRIGRRAAAFICALLVCCVAAGCAEGNGNGAGSGDEAVAAKYGDSVITEAEVNEYTAEFRAEHAYEDDQNWAKYLYEQGLTAQTWRNQAIGSIVEKRLIASRAAELGIVADQELVQAQEESDKEAAGIDADDEEAWESYLEARGTTVQDYRKNLEDASVQYQLLRQEISLDPVEDSAVFDKYIQDNLVSRVVRRYKVLVYDTQEAAQQALDSLSGLTGDALATAFDGLLESDNSDETSTDNGGDAGWDIASDWGAMQQELNDEMVVPGSLSERVHEMDGKYYVALCTDRFVFELDTTYNDLPDEKLKAYVFDVATYSSWSQLTSDYIARLREEAGVQVHEMPDRVPYNVDVLIEANAGS